MNRESVAAEKCWPRMSVAIQGFWELINPIIEQSAAAWDIPDDLYYFGELGLNYFSRADFQERDRFSNPQLFDELFERLSQSGWITPVEPHRYEVTRKAREAARKITQAGYDYLATLQLLPEEEAKRLADLLAKIVQACADAAEPPKKRAFIRRFRVATRQSPAIVRIFEYLMDLFAYRDDVHLATWEVHPVTGLMWNTFSLLWSNSAVTPNKMAEQLAFRGYDAHHYLQALEDLCNIGWILKTTSEPFFQVSEKANQIRNQVEASTDVEFYRPWSILSEKENKELCSLISKLNTSL